ncbi:SDR family NAD(P)-dependent oxidoreductase [Streptomyces sp. NBC_01233]|uniref:SDR family NAD(P)-dependent oxidoreductase n=1 Tax=Streptomyces sp. NBC_01233 TaxID=2903787 RepID=UPI002E129015|nr:SDR family NAD(P)-dependent oxidoreductase [Streptomyces sp. NBC_01233]
MQTFTGKVAVVTGAGSGIGRAFAERFAGEGMKVVLADVEEAALHSAVAELREKDHDVIGVVTDVSSRDSMLRLADAALAAYGKVHVVCNNAGVEGYLDGPVWAATEKDWQWTLGVNFYGVLHGVQTFLPILLQQQEEAHMVNTASMLSLVRSPNIYGVTKQAVLALSETVYGDLKAMEAQVGITVLIPGTIATNLFHGSRNRPDELRAGVDLAATGKGRMLRDRMHGILAEGMPPDEVADIAVWAIREKAFYVLTDHEWDEQIRRRTDDVLLGRLPRIAP